MSRYVIIQGVVLMELYKPDAQLIIGIGRVYNGVRAKRSNISGNGDYSSLDAVSWRNRERRGCSANYFRRNRKLFRSLCEQNQSLCVFGGPCSERVTMVTLGMTGAGFSGTPTSGAVSPAGAVLC